MGNPGSRRYAVIRRSRLCVGVVIGLLFPGLLQAYAVGEPQLLSRYAQPLRLQVPVTLSNADEIADLSELSARLLPLSAYENLGLPAPPLSSQSISIRVFGEGVSYMVEITTPQIIREPFLTLVLEVRARGVRVMRELPLLFDLPVEEPATAPLPAVTATVETPAAAAPPPANVLAAPVAAANAAAESVMTSRSASAPRLPTKSRRTLRLESLQLKSVADPATTGASALPPAAASLPRFQLSMSFDSYAQRKAAGEVIEPAVLRTTPAAVTTMASAAARAAPVRSPEPMSASESDGGFFDMLLAFLAGVIVAVVATRWLTRRRVTAPRSLPEAQGPEPARPMSTAPAEAVEAALPAPTKAAPAEAFAGFEVRTSVGSSVSAEQESIHRRVRELHQGNNDLNLARKLQLVEAYLDLGRTESAVSLLAELEAALPKVARPSFMLIKG